MKHDTTMRDGIEAALKALHRILQRSATDAEVACSHIRSHGQNTAIGGIIPIEDALNQATALYHALIAMHRFKQ